MRHKKLINQGKTLRMGFVFLGLVFFLIISSFVSKLIGVARLSVFDGEHRFTVLLQEVLDKEKNTLISFAPDTKSISVLTVGGVDNANVHKISLILGVPIDGFVVFSSLQNKKNVNSGSYIQSFLRQGALQQDILQTNLTFFDFARLWFFTRSISDYEIVYDSYSISLSTDALSDAVLDKLAGELFMDDTLSKEKMSIHIVNASGVTGLGNRIARLFTNSGGNVIAVSTGENILSKSEVGYTGKDSYTLKRVIKLLDCKAKILKNQAISDIVITVGIDKAGQFAL